ncbi:hypothetical protein ACPV47_25015, partial [Vibrio jasicida]
MPLAITGCNGGDSEKTNTNTPELTTPVTITAQNANFFVELAEYYTVDLTDKVITSHGAQFQLSDVQALTTSPECAVSSISATSFTIAADRVKACDYRYEVSALDSKSAVKKSSETQSVSSMSNVSSATDSAITRIAMMAALPTEPSEVELSAISNTTTIEQNVVTSVKAQLLQQAGYNMGTGFTLDSELSLPYSN